MISELTMKVGVINGDKPIKSSTKPITKKEEAPIKIKKLRLKLLTKELENPPKE